MRHPPDFGPQTAPSPLRALQVRVDPLADERDDAGSRDRNQVGDRREARGSRRIMMHQNVPDFVSRTLAGGLRLVGLKPAAPGGPCDASISGVLTHYWVDALTPARDQARAAAWVEADIIVRRCPAGESLLRKRYSGRADKAWAAAAASRGEDEKRLGGLLDEATKSMAQELFSDPDFEAALLPLAPR